MSTLFLDMLAGLMAVVIVGVFAFMVYWILYVHLPRQRAFEELLAKEGFRKVPQLKSINKEPFLGSSERVYKAWEKGSSQGRIRVLFLQTGSGESSSTRVVLEAKVKPGVQDFLVMPGRIPNWMAKGFAMIGRVNLVELPRDLADRYKVFAAKRTDVFPPAPFELPVRLAEYLKVQDGLVFSVASSSLLVERRILEGDRLFHHDICNPESFATAMSDLTALVPLVSEK